MSFINCNWSRWWMIRMATFLHSILAVATSPSSSRTRMPRWTESCRQLICQKTRTQNNRNRNWIRRPAAPAWGTWHRTWAAINRMQEICRRSRPIRITSCGRTIRHSNRSSNIRHHKRSTLPGWEVKIAPMERSTSPPSMERSQRNGRTNLIWLLRSRWTWRRRWRARTPRSKTSTRKTIIKAHDSRAIL